MGIHIKNDYLTIKTYIFEIIYTWYWMSKGKLKIFLYIHDAFPGDLPNLK